MHVLEKFRYCPTCGSERFEIKNEKSKKCAACGFEYYLNPSAAVAAFVFNEKGELLVVKRKKEPAKGTLDLPGGFCDMGETIEESLHREVKEETNLEVTALSYLMSIPNDYIYSGFNVPTMDSFFVCKAVNETEMRANDDAETAFWLPLNQLCTTDFGLTSIRKATMLFQENKDKILKKIEKRHNI
ncbi:MAG: NUDIX domain-containing protein [Prevotella sp.]|nr:NUDIX domain-containing protein [Prevotellaceae bacterium]MDY3935658.1 NUDIX domain-containing protein [Prevotella sp.]